jgi:hypothetical protein
MRLVLHGESPVGFCGLYVLTLKAASVVMTSALQRKDELSLTVHYHLLIIYGIGSIFMALYTDLGARGGVVVKALHYKPAGRGFDSRWCHWNFSVT